MSSITSPVSQSVLLNLLFTKPHHFGYLKNSCKHKSTTTAENCRYNKFNNVDSGLQVLVIHESMHTMQSVWSVLRHEQVIKIKLNKQMEAAL